MLVNLLNVPRSDPDWEVWAFSHKEHHDQIRQAIQRTKNINLEQYQLNPIVKEPEWLKRNAQSHDDMNLALGLQGSDIEELDFNDEKQLQSWIYAHYLEHQDAAKFLQI